MADKDPKVVAPSDVADDNAKQASELNKGVEKAGEEAANRLQGQRKERFNVTDAVLGEDEKHGVEVKKAQAATFGEDYDPSKDPEVTPPEISPGPSQNQNNLKHPDDKDSNDPHSARNYLGQQL